jgi:flagellar motility protein MotE (MotC chaperone)
VAEKVIKAENQSIVPPKARVKPASSAVSGSKAGSSKSVGFAAGFITCLLVFILALGAIAVAFWLNLGDIRTMIIVTLRLSDTEFRYLETRHSELTDTESDLAENTKKLASDWMALEQKTAEFAAKEDDLKTRASELDALATSLSEQKADLGSIVSIYEAMEPQKAAAIINVPGDLATKLKVIKNMNKNKLALILAEMTPEQAAGILAQIGSDDIYITSETAVISIEESKP